MNRRLNDKLRETLDQLAGIERQPKPPRRLRPKRARHAQLEPVRELEFLRGESLGIVSAFEWASSYEVPRMKGEGGNPYYDFWRRVDGNTGYYSLLIEDPISQEFEDIQKLQRAFQGADIGPHTHRMWADVASVASRSYGTAFYSWGIPSPEAIEAITALDMPIFESGSGRGYWAWQLEQRRARVVAWEPGALSYAWFWRRPNRIHRRSIPRDHALLFCWPENGGRYAARQLREYAGSTVIFVGEPQLCAEEQFYRLLNERFAPQEQQVRLPSWRYIRDQMTIFRRK